MADSRGAFQITPEEERFLRAFFRRHAGRYLLLGALLVGAAAAGALLLGAPPGAAEDPERWVREVQELRAAQQGLKGALDDLRTENRGLRAELERVARLAPPAAAADGAASRGLEQRVAALARRLDSLEGRVVRAASKPVAPTPELGDLVERLDTVQARLAIEAQARENFQKSVLNRLYAVENGMVREPPPAPGAIAP